MSLQAQPNSTGQVIDTLTTVAGKEKQVVLTNCAPPGGANFAIAHTPGTATQATITQAAAAAGVRNVCTSISFSLQTVGTLQTPIQVNLRDGATGAGTILWSMTVACAVSSIVTFGVSGLNLVGTAATAMTLEFSAAGVAASSCSVSMVGFTTA